MAEVIKSMPPVRQGSRLKYPWEQWFDGQIWKLTQGVDFADTVQGFRTSVWSAAGTRKITVEIHAAGNAVMIQAIRDGHPAR